MNQEILLSNTYLGPVEYYRTMANHAVVRIEQCDHFEKQTYRNRCRIMTCNQLMDLSVPIIRPKEKCATRDILISYHEKWQQTQWRAIESAYNSSPFFEYYREDYEPFFLKETKYLVDLNMGLMETTLDLLHLRPAIHLTERYETQEELGKCLDGRELFHPKKTFVGSDIRPYYQVFSPIFGFQPNLSIIDLLFNLGPEALLYLSLKPNKSAS